MKGLTKILKSIHDRMAGVSEHDVLELLLMPDELAAMKEGERQIDAGEYVVLKESDIYTYANGRGYNFTADCSPQKK